MNREIRTRLLLVLAFSAAYFLPADSLRLHKALVSALSLRHGYAREHVLFCLVPAFFIAGPIATDGNNRNRRTGPPFRPGGARRFLVFRTRRVAPFRVRDYAPAAGSAAGFSFFFSFFFDLSFGGAGT